MVSFSRKKVRKRCNVPKQNSRESESSPREERAAQRPAAERRPPLHRSGQRERTSAGPEEARLCVSRQVSATPCGWRRHLSCVLKTLPSPPPPLPLTHTPPPPPYPLLPAPLGTGTQIPYGRHPFTRGLGTTTLSLFSS